jgi:hypothetical protein
MTASLDSYPVLDREHTALTVVTTWWPVAYLAQVIEYEVPDRAGNSNGKCGCGGQPENLP